jgi:hypothetical protein
VSLGASIQVPSGLWRLLRIPQGAPGDALGVPWESLGVPWSSLELLGTRLGSLGASRVSSEGALGLFGDPLREHWALQHWKSDVLLKRE